MESNETDSAAPVEVPLEALSEEALNEIIASFIEREGTDYGTTEASFEKKAADIRRQLNRGEIKLFFDPSSESINFLPKSRWP